MRVLLLVVCLAMAVAPAARAQARLSPHSYTPPAGFVPDSITAVRVALAIWTPIYGKAVVESERPYHAVLQGKIWRVVGSMPAGKGGVALIEIAKADGRVLHVSHGK